MTVFGGRERKKSKIGYICAFMLKDFIIVLISSNIFKAITARKELGFMSVEIITDILEGIPFNQILLYKKDLLAVFLK